MRIMMVLCLALALGGCAATVDTGSTAPDVEPAPSASHVEPDAGRDGAVDLCGDVVLQKPWGEPCVADAECLAKGTGNACVCKLCVVSY